MTEDRPFISPLHGAMLEDLADKGTAPSLMYVGSDLRWCCQIVLEVRRKRARYNFFGAEPCEAISLAYDAYKDDSDDSPKSRRPIPGGPLMGGRRTNSASELAAAAERISRGIDR